MEETITNIILCISIGIGVLILVLCPVIIVYCLVDLIINWIKKLINNGKNKTNG